MDDDEVWAPPSTPLPPPERRRWSTLQVVLVTLATVLVVSGIVMVGLVLMFVVGMNQYASNK